MLEQPLLSASATSCNNMLVSVMPPELSQSVSFWSMVMALATRQNILDPQIASCVNITNMSCICCCFAALVKLKCKMHCGPSNNYSPTIVKYLPSSRIIYKNNLVFNEN